MMTFLYWLNPLNWFKSAIGIMLVLSAAAGAVYWAYDAVGDARETQVVARYTKAEFVASEKIKQREADNFEKSQKASHEKIKSLEVNLAAAGRANAAGQRLRDALRAGEGAAQTDLAACVQRARALSGLLESSAELARRISKEADGHVADKVACAAAWPK